MLRFEIFLLFIAFVFLGYVLPQWASYPAATSPLIAMIALLGGQITIASLVALAFAAPCTVKRRFFCRKICPLGFCFSIVGRVRRRVTGTNRLPPFLRRCPRFGVLLVLLTLLGSVGGVIGFLWLDPLVLFASPLRNGVWLFPLLGIIFLLSWFAPTFWCRKICPLGGMQDMLYAPNVLISKPKVNVRREQRRQLLQLGGGVVLFGGLFAFLRPWTTAMDAPLRPPGAIDEPLFLARCTRCGTCSQVCPTKVITLYSENTTVGNLGTPQLHFDPAWCREDCVACMHACPSGALKRLKPSEKKIGLAVFEFEYCRLYDDKECTLCGRECPSDAISFQWSEEEYRRIVHIDSERCNGCGRCIVSCPVKGKERPLNVIR